MEIRHVYIYLYVAEASRCYSAVCCYLTVCRTYLKYIKAMWLCYSAVFKCPNMKH